MSVKDINIKNRTYYFFNNINIKDFDVDIKINEKSYKNILIYYIGYKAIKKDKSVNTLYLLNPLKRE